MGKRATTRAAKTKKAVAIMDCAADMFLASDYDSVKMADIAKRMGISNGILYVYFPTKQLLFLSLLMREYHAWIDALEGRIQGKAVETFGALSDLILDDLAQQLNNALYVRLEAIRAAILEANIDIRQALVFKADLYRRMCGLAEKIAVPGVISVREILELYHVQTALIEGFQLASDVPDSLREQLLQNGMEAFVHDFREDTLRTMRLYLQAYEAAKAKP